MQAGPHVISGLSLAAPTNGALPIKARWPLMRLPDRTLHNAKTVALTTVQGRSCAPISHNLPEV